ncbi:hypothetical protein [Shewanella sp. LZH-2]|uniref:hypothetical protein n=1 Tax=Shewanella sp. LZH-2 TaxID=2806008 RepID=UPI00193E6CBD|nr:hypothetical protein [Shewanella sp. LZH-2]QRK79887.1 hypothetical protein JM642_01780 [Shewanella sp. LZH-2]
MKPLVASILLGISLLASPVWAQDYTVETYQEIFKGDNQFKQKQAIEALTLAGLSDPAIYDVLEAKLIASLPQATEKNAIDYSAWLVKGLAYSGNDKYSGTINNIINGDYHKKLKKYATQALENLDQYKKWNAILGDKSQYVAEQSTKNNAYANAFKSNDLELMRLAAKRMMDDQNYDDFLLECLSVELKNPRLMSNDKLAIDTYANMAKALAASGNPQYREVIENIANNNPNKKLKSYAESYLKKYY